jgi:uncharacterized glyoxalase superfamily protein PhnB
MSEATPPWHVAPVLVVRDVSASIGWWQDLIGFRVLDTFKDPPVMAFVERRGVQFMLQGNGGAIPGPNRAFMPGIWDAHVWVDDADALHAEIKARGAQVTDVHDTFYGNREFEATDPDGYIIAFGSPTMRR